jgi:hypothetical protein
MYHPALLEKSFQGKILTKDVIYPVLYLIISISGWNYPLPSQKKDIIQDGYARA